MKEIFDLKTSGISGRILIEASAGTGKTYSLEHIVSRLIVEKTDVSIDRVLVVTFTNSAAAELKERIRSLLIRLDAFLGAKTAAAGNVAADGTEQELAQQWQAHGVEVEKKISAALENFEDASIFTIHGFCQKILAEFSFSRGTGSEINIGDTAELRSSVIEDFCRGMAPSLSPDDGCDLLTWPLEPLLRKLTLQQPGASTKVIFHPEGMKEKWIKKNVILPSDAVAGAIEEFAWTAPEKLRRAKAGAGISDHDDTLYEMNRLASTNPEFVRRVRDRYGAVLIDEFQDTDPVQYSIFRRLFLDDDGCGPLPGTVIFVGDPKQSIYSFRNSDLDTYLRARDDLDNTLELDTNFRSTPALVSTINTIFSMEPLPGTGDSAEHFLDRRIEFNAVRSTGSRLPLLEKKNGTLYPVPAFSVWLTPDDGEETFSKTGEVDEAEARWIAADIASTLTRDIYISRDGVFRRLEPQDISILVRKHKSCSLIIEKLREKGIRCRCSSREDVFSTPEAAEILVVLRALASPGDGRVRARARSTHLFGRSLREIRENDELLVEDGMLIGDCLKIWNRSGLAAAFAHLMNARETAFRLLRCTGGERRLMNYQHIISLLAVEQQALGTPAAMAEYFEAAIGRKVETPEGRKLRTESDANVVSVQTVHNSKGLEYPVVYIAGVREFQQADRDKVVVEETDTGQSCLLRKSPNSSCSYETALRHSREEEVRLAYVAMTRASCRLVLPLFVSRDNGNKRWLTNTFRHAFSYAIFGQWEFGESVFAPKSPYTAGINRYLDWTVRVRAKLSLQASCFAQAIRDNADPAACGHACGFCPDLENVGHYFEVVRRAPVSGILRSAQENLDFAAARAVTVKQSWIQSSFTSISRGLGDTDFAEEDYEGDEPLTETDTLQPGGSPDPGLYSSAAVPSPGIFPCGPEAGDWLHRRLEFFISTGTMPEYDTLFKHLKNAPFVAACAPAEIENFAREAQTMLTTALSEPLYRDDDGDITVRQVSFARRSAEMDFLIKVENPVLNTKTLVETLSGLGYFFKTKDAVRELYGYLTGSIDLMVEVNGKFWIIDWKSNVVGAGLCADYSDRGMREAMNRHHYALQYLIYLTALKRHLVDCLGISGDEAWEHIGGVLYVFLRGLDPDDPGPAHGPRRGVFLDRPRGAVDALDALLKGENHE